MTMPHDRKFSFIPLFGSSSDHSTVPAKVRMAVARSEGQGRPSGRRFSASPLAAASTMAALRSLGAMLCIATILAVLMLSSSAAHAGQASPATHRADGRSADPFAALVTEASRRFAVPEHWIRAVMRVESGEKSRARSQKGATGLMQIIPKTWAELRARHGLGVDPYDPHDNILAGAAYIRELHDRYGTPGRLSPSKGRLPGPTLHCSRRAARAPYPIVNHPLACVRTVHHAPMPLSTCRPSYRSRATCLYVSPEESGRNDRDRASSHSFAEYSMS
jgi:hypothetical protein